MKTILEFFYDETDVVCFKMEKAGDETHPWCIGVAREDGTLEELLMTREEAKKLLKFLKSHLEPQLENK